MTKPLAIIGCGGFGRQVHDLVDQINASEPAWELLGYIDDNPSPANRELVRARGVDVLGGLAWFDRAPSEVLYIVGVGSPQVKREIDARLNAHSPATLVHPNVTMGSHVTLGPGTVICAHTCLMNNIRVGRHVHINSLCSIGHDTVIHDFVSINPMASISGWVVLGSASMIGTQAAILQDVSVGCNAVVGASACVVGDTSADSTVKGVPAR